MKTCPDCGCRVYEYGCVNCNEQAYIDAQEQVDVPWQDDEELNMEDRHGARPEDYNRD